MTYLALLLAALALAAVLSRRARSGSPESQRFWRDLALAACCGLIAATLEAATPETPRIAWALATTGMDALAYSFVAMAAGQQPYHVSPWQVPRLHNHWLRPGVLIAVAGAWTYVILVPALSAAGHAASPAYGQGLSIVLALYVTIRLAAEAVGAHQAADHHWRRVLTWLFVAAMAWLASRLIRAFQPPTDSMVPTILSAVLTLAAGAGLLAATLAREPTSSTTTPELWTSPRATPMRSTLQTTIFALAFPIAHIVFHAMGTFPEALRTYRERVVLAALLLLGALALVQRTLLRQRSAALTAEHRRIEAMIRQHQTSLELSKARRSASTSIRDAADRFERTFRACPSLMAIVDADDGEILEVNDSFERIAGRSRQEVLGQPAGAFGLWPNADDAAPWTEALRRGDSVRDHRIALSDHRGKVHTLRVSAAAVDLGHRMAYLLLARDVTDHEALLRDTTRHAAWLTDTSAVLMVVDAEDCLTTWSRGAGHFFGRQLDTVRGQRAAALLGGGDTADWTRLFVRARASGHGLARLLATTPSGGGVPVACRFASVTDHRERAHLLLVLTPMATPGERVS